jgi:hypothetical protein
VTAGAEHRLLLSVSLFHLGAELVAALRAHQARRKPDPLAQQYDAFMLDPGLGPATYITSDGRILWDDDLWGVLGTRAEALAAVMAGIKKTGISALREILPERPPHGADCGNCAGTGRWSLPNTVQGMEPLPENADQ